MEVWFLADTESDEFSSSARDTLLLDEGCASYVFDYTNDFRV
jgi:hypothetical protein